MDTYINNYQKDLFIQYTGDASFSASTIRTLRADVSFFVDWYTSSDHKNIHSYPTYLKKVCKNENVFRRRVYSFNKFTAWLKSTYNLAFVEEAALGGSEPIPSIEASPPNILLGFTKHRYWYAFLIPIIFVSVVAYYLSNNYYSYSIKSVNDQINNKNTKSEKKNYVSGSIPNYVSYLEHKKSEMLVFKFVFLSLLESKNSTFVLTCKLLSRELVEVKGAYSFDMEQCDGFDNQMVKKFGLLPFKVSIYVDDSLSGERYLNLSQTQMNSASSALPNKINVDKTEPSTNIDLLLNALRNPVDLHQSESNRIDFETSSSKLDTINGKNILNGTLIGFDGTFIRLAQISDTFLGVTHDSGISRTGIVDLLIATESASILAGDSLTLSNVPGYAVKSVDPSSFRIGYALESSSTQSALLKTLLAE